jgi:hypothetical protein
MRCGLVAAGNYYRTTWKIAGGAGINWQQIAV